MAICWRWNTWRIHPSLLAIAILLTVIACKASPAPDSGFIDQPELMKHDHGKPFDAIWVKKGLDLRKYKKVMVSPVVTYLLKETSWWDRIASFQAVVQPDFQKDAQGIADYMRTQVTASYRDAAYQIMDEPDSDTLIIELALVEIVPTKVWLNAISMVFVGAVDTGSVAFEARFRDGGTNKIVVRLKDREFGQMSLLSIADLRWYSHAKHIIDHWSEQLLQLTKLPPRARIHSQSPVTLRPW